jgi:hypothetical protein
MQTQGTALLPYEYTGLSDVLQKTLKYEGVRGLFKGLTPNLLKVSFHFYPLLTAGGTISIYHLSRLYQCMQGVWVTLEDCKGMTRFPVEMKV